MTDVENLPVVSAIPQLDEVNDLEEDAIERINHLYQVMTSSPAGIESNVKWRPEKLKLRHPVTSDQMMPDQAQIGDLYANGKLLWSRDNDGRSDPFKFVLCYSWQSRARFQEGDNRPDCTSADCVINDFGTLKCADCPDEPFKHGKPTKCNDTLNMVILPVDLSGVYIARFSKSSYSAGSNVTKVMRGHQTAWARMFGLTTKERTGSSHTWNVYQTTPIDEEVPEEVKLFASHVSETYASMREQYLEERQKTIENAEVGLDAMSEGLGSAMEDDDAGFDDTM